MDWLTFIYGIINALAWPSTVVAAMIIFKQPLRELIGAIINIKWKDGEITLERAIKDVAAKADEATLPPPTSPTKVDIRVNDTVSVTGSDGASLGELYAPVMILQSWLSLETELRNIAERLGLSRSKDRTTLQIAHELWLRCGLDKATLDIFTSLRQLRNQVVHVRPDSVTTGQALEYDSTVRRLIARLKEIESVAR